MHTRDSADLLTDIDAFLARTGMAESTFGQKALKNSKLMARLRGGGTVTLKTAEKIRSFIRTYRRCAAGTDGLGEARHG